MHKVFLAFILLGGAVIAGFFVVRNLGEDSFDLPRGNETEIETVVIEEGQVIGTIEEVEVNEMENETKPTTSRTTREIMVTDGVRHTIPLDEILQGCPGKDCIPSIDSPEFESTAQASAWLEDSEPGVAFSRGNVSRFYPYQVLVRREIVNDTIEGQRTLITYCPLCLTGIVFDPIVDGEQSEFGVSGLLWESNLIMYDRNTETLWSQVLGEAILGDLAGTKLEVLPSDQLLYGNWKKANPDGEVLSRSGGFGGNPYGDSYFDLPSISINFAQPTDTRLPFDTFVFGVMVKGKTKAYDVDAVKQKGEITDTFNGTTFRLTHDTTLDVVRIFAKQEDGTEKRFNPISGFWFSWSEAHPDTELYP